MLFALLFDLAAAAPFVTTWITDADNNTIQLPTIQSESNITIDWGDLTSAESFANGEIPTHHYASPNTYTVSIEGRFSWASVYSRLRGTTAGRMIDILSWGDGIWGGPYMFADFPNVRVSAPPNTQPMFPPNSVISGFFMNTAFDSPLNWDLLNVTDIREMFRDTPLKQPITFRNTQGVEKIDTLFYWAAQFNQPFHFDASGVTSASFMFQHAHAFNSTLNLSNSSQLLDVTSMFSDALSFNQPITFNTTSVIKMGSMFKDATNFNQPINFNSPNLTSADDMFSGAVSFNQPVVLNTSSVTTMARMFFGATSFASTVSFTSTAKVVDMTNMFAGANLFTRNLSGWDTGLVTQCNSFCLYCGLSTFPSCDPCGSVRLTNQEGVSVCSTFSPTPLPSAAPSSAAPSAAPSSAAPPGAVSPAAAAVPSLACGLLVLTLSLRL